MGTVKRIDPQNLKITLEHEAIRYVFGKSTTTFAVNDAVISSDLKAGDRISFTLKISEGKSVIMKMNVLD
jgi:Cu/Ag efflux protein CusF